MRIVLDILQTSSGYVYSHGRHWLPLVMHQSQETRSNLNQANQAFQHSTEYFMVLYENTVKILSQIYFFFPGWRVQEQTLFGWFW